MEEKDAFEAAYWGACVNTYDEETKQYAYASRMGIMRMGFGFDGQGESVIDIGGGPVSMLLKADIVGARLVVDPGASYWPTWVMHRYGAEGVDVKAIRGEDLDLEKTHGEAWIYNVLQHTDDPERVLHNALRAARNRLRIFEWIEMPAYDGHPQTLTAEDLTRWIGRGYGIVEYVNEGGAVGKAFYGAFTP